MTVRCDACKRVLTDAASIARRLGPTCAGRRGACESASEVATGKTKVPRVRRRATRKKWAQLEMWSENANDGRIELTGGAPKS